ncbi:hypothetical protein [Bartonella sp. TT121SHDZB]
MKFKKELNALKEKINKVIEHKKEVKVKCVEELLAAFCQIFKKSKKGFL